MSLSGGGGSSGQALDRRKPVSAFSDNVLAPAGHAQHGSGDIGRGVRQQEQDALRDLLGCLHDQRRALRIEQTYDGRPVLTWWQGDVTPTGLINSGGESKGAADLQNAVLTAVINKRAGGMGLISGRKAFQRAMNEGVSLLNAIQDVYLTKEVTIA